MLPELARARRKADTTAGQDPPPKCARCATRAGLSAPSLLTLRSRPSPAVHVRRSARDRRNDRTRPARPSTSIRAAHRATIRPGVRRQRRKRLDRWWPGPRATSQSATASTRAAPRCLRLARAATTLVTRRRTGPTGSVTAARLGYDGWSAWSWCGLEDDDDFTASTMLRVRWRDRSEWLENARRLGESRHRAWSFMLARGTMISTRKFRTFTTRGCKV